MSWRTPLAPALAVGAALTAAAAAGLVEPRPLLSGYLAAFLLVVGAPVGGLSILMVHHLTGGRWGRALRRPLESMLPTIPVLALLFAPVLFGMAALFPWVDPRTPAQVEAAGHTELYLNVPFFILRAVVFFGVWTLLAAALRGLSRSPRGATGGLARLSGGGLVAWVLTVSFAAVDWVGSLVPGWYSSVIGLYLLISFVVTSFCVATLVVTAPGRTIEPDVLHDLGNLLLTLVVLHAYLAFSQFLIIWNGDRPQEISWYLPRAEPVWLWMYGAFTLLHFALPLAVLLLRTVKRRAAAMRTLVAVILAARAAEAVYWVVPNLERSQGLAAASAALATVTVGGLWTASFLWWRRRDLESRA